MVTNVAVSIINSDKLNRSYDDYFVFAHHFFGTQGSVLHNSIIFYKKNSS